MPGIGRTTYNGAGHLVGFDRFGDEAVATRVFAKQRAEDGQAARCLPGQLSRSPAFHREARLLLVEAGAQIDWPDEFDIAGWEVASRPFAVHLTATNSVSYLVG